MGSRLEKNSSDVRKRIAGHTFDGEDGEEYAASKFGGFTDYMRRKKIKLQNLDAELRSQSDKPQVFRNVVAYVNGYTQPSLADLHVLIVSHGGGFLQYLDGKTAVTHVIASQLTPKKKVEFARYRIVKPAWVVDSVQAGRLLPWENYRVVDEGVKQKVLGFDSGHMVSQASNQKQGYRDQSDTSWYTSQVKDVADRVNGVPSSERADDFEAQFDEQEVDDNGPGTSQLLADDDLLQAEATLQPQPVEETSTIEGNQTIGSAEEIGAVHAAETEHDVSTSDMVQNPQTAGSPPVGGGATTPEKRALTAEEHNAILLQNPHMAKSSTANPDFLNQYYRESRLHHLSTWKAELKAQLQARAQESSSQKQKLKRPPGTRRYIMHVDFDSFFAAVSLRENPQLKEKPVVVAHGSGPGSEIASCNYPARNFGVKNGMWMKHALEVCPDLKVLPYDYKAYEDASKHFYDAILAIDGIVQSISIDEALIDVSEQCIRAGGSDGRGMSEGSVYREQAKANELAQALRNLVREKTGCEVSVGIGGNILLAKVALRKAKPAGQHLITPEAVLDFIADLTVTQLPGVAYSIGNKLEEIGVKFVKDIRGLTKEKLVNTLGPKTGEKLWDYSRGVDKQQVGEQVIRKSVSAEVNWGIRFVNQQQAEEFVMSLCEELSKRLLEQLVKGRQLTMKIMRKAADAGLDPPKNLGHGKCDTFNKSVVLGVATNDKLILGKEAVAILRGYGFPPGELRGLGVQMQKLEPLKPSMASSATPLESSQRRLQFKKPEMQTKTPSRPSPAPSSIYAKPNSLPLSNQGSAQTPTPKVKKPEDLIEEVPTPEKSRTLSARHDLSQLEDSSNTPLNIGGTQFVIPSQIDPSVLAELPADIRSKLAPRTSKLFERYVKQDSASDEARSRSQSPFVSDSELALPNESQLDPETLAALPDDVREELLAEYRNASRTSASSKTQQLLPQSPRKARPLPTKKLSTTPKKKHKFTSLMTKGRSKTNSAFLPTLTQSNFVSMKNGSTSAAVDALIANDDISAEFLQELPEEIRAEILAEQKRQRMKQKSGLNLAESRKRNRPGKKDEVIRGQQKLSIPRPDPKPTFTSRKLSTVPELREAMSQWVQAFSGDGEEGPYQEDTEALGVYLNRVVLEEGDMAKAQAVVDWLVYVVGDWPFENGQTSAAWQDTIGALKSAVQLAVGERGLAPLQFNLARQQEQAASRLPNPLKIPSMHGITFPSRPKRTLSSVSGNGNNRIRQRLSRGVSNIRSFFKSRTADSENCNNDYPATQALFISQQGTQAGFSSAPSLTKNPLRLHLTGMDMTEQERQLLLRSGPRSAEPGSTRQDSPVSFTSAGSLRRRVSQKFRGAFSPSSPTVIRKPELRARPSVQTICNDRSSATSGTLSLPSSGRTSTTQKQNSTPPTSEGTMSGSPGSVRKHEIDLAAANNQLLVLFDHHNICPRKLSTIHEVDKGQIATIKTVEATAAAKVFFETHFNALLNRDSPRQKRHEDLEQRLARMQLPPYLKHRDGRHAVKVGAYQVVKVLGKGSFGVVRLVRDQEVLFAAARQNGKLRRVESQPLSNSASRKSSMVTLVQGLSRSRHQMLPPNKEIYAMKVIRKADMLRNAQEGHLRAERNFLVAAEGSKWVVPLITAFQDAKHLYLVMDFCVGGDFLGLLIRKSILSEQITKWYVAEMILCVEEAHKMKWIHRDVKPDNFLIGADGHLKISDFGLAFDGFWEHDQKYFHKHRHSLMSSLGVDVEGDTEDQRDAARRKRRQAEGKEGYESPPNIPDEKLCAATKERLVDWRNRNQRRKLARSVVGTKGFTPFACEDRQNTKLRILRHKETLHLPELHDAPQPVTSNALDLIRRLLVEKEIRLCTRRYELNDYTRKFLGKSGARLVPADKTHRNYNGYFVYPEDAEDIKNHPFFGGIPWGNMQDYSPPFTPRVKSWEDTKYFDDEPISDIESSTSEDDSQTLKPDGAILDPSHHQQEAQVISPETPGAELEPKLSPPPYVKVKKPKEKKRPRDKILRDPNVGKMALQTRKDSAFIGYGYRKAKNITDVIEEALTDECAVQNGDITIEVNGQS